MFSVEKNERSLTASQAQVLEVLEAADRPMTLAELQSATGLHGNTLRGHLCALHDRGRLTRVAVRRPARGRPAWAYLARESEYEALAIALAEGLLSAEDTAPAAVASEGGRAWGERLRARVAPEDDLSPRDRAVRVLEHTGFAPSVEGNDILLNACPLLEAARTHPSVVCAVHLGLVEGVTGRRDSVELKPKPDTLGCRVVVR